MGATILKSLHSKAEGSFGVFPTDQSTYAALPAEQIEWTPEAEHLAREVQSRTLGAKQTGITGRKGGTLTFRVGLHGLTAAATGAPSEYGWMADLMAACGMTRSTGAGTTVSGTGSTTTAVDVADAAGFAVGRFAVIGGEARLVTAVDTSGSPHVLTVTPALSSAPGTNGAPVHGSVNYRLTGTTPAGTVSLIAGGDGYTYIFSGCAGTVTLETVAAGERPMLAFTLQVDRWTRDPSTLTGTLPALTMPSAIVAKASPFYWGASLRAVRDVAFDPALNIVALETTAGAEGRSGWRYTDAVPVLNATAYRSTDTSDTLQADFEAHTTRTALLQLGAAAGGIFAVAAEVAQLTSYPAEGDADGLVTLPMTAEVKASSTATMPLFAMGFC